jgi:hypothetical protein
LIFRVQQTVALNDYKFSMYSGHVAEVTHLPGFLGPTFRSRDELSHGTEEDAAMDIPEDPQERKQWMMQLLQDYGREFLILEPGKTSPMYSPPLSRNTVMGAASL